MVLVCGDDVVGQVDMYMLEIWFVWYFVCILQYVNEVDDGIVFVVVFGECQKQCVEGIVGVDVGVYYVYVWQQGEVVCVGGFRIVCGYDYLVFG